MPVPLTRARGGSSAAPLPDPYPSLAGSRYNVKLRRGQVVMVAGPPGGGKTMWSLVAAIRMAQQGATCLYISADSDEETMATRAAAAVTKHPVRHVEETLQYGLFHEEYGVVLAGLPIRFEYDDSDPTIQDLTHAMTAWLECWGEYPHLLVVDNLMNMESGDSNEWQGMRKSMRDLHWLARKTKTCILVLHHTSEQNSQDIVRAPARNSIQGKVSQLPPLILTLASDGPQLMVAVVKNRRGAADPLAQDPVRLFVDFSTCQILDQAPTNTWLTGVAEHGQQQQFAYR